MSHPNTAPGLGPRLKQAVASWPSRWRALALPGAAQGADIGTLQARVDEARQQARTLASSLQMRTAELAAAQGRAAAAGRRQAELEATLARGVARARVLEARVTAAQERLARAQERSAARRACSPGGWSRSTRATRPTSRPCCWSPTASATC